MAKKIVVLDGFALNPGDLSWDPIKKFGEVVVYDKTSPRQISERIGNADIVLTNKTPISEEVLEEAANLRFISVLATGYDVIDLSAASKFKVAVSNVPEYGTYSVAQSAIALLLEICNQIGWHNNSVQQGIWEIKGEWSYWETPLIELKDKVMGIIGLGKIGKITASIGKALGMKIIAYDVYASDKNMTTVEFVSFEELCRQADVVVLHCPLTKENFQLMNKKAFSLMKSSAILINNARGKLINEKDLAEALDHDEIYAAGLDVVSEEPIQKNNPLLKAKNCFITPHISWGSIEARKRIMKETEKNIGAFLEGTIINQVNGDR